VVVAAAPVLRGQILTADQLTTAQVSGLEPASLTPASELTDLVGQTVVVDVPVGAPVPSSAVTSDPLPAAGQAVVGILLPAGQVPTVDLLPGARVRIVATPSQAGVPAATPGAPTSVAAVVVSTFTGTDTTGQGAQTIITVDVPSGDAAQLAAMAASSKVAVVLDSRDR